jgi:hypothetical protein
MELFKSQFEQWEDEFIINNYNNLTYKQICEYINLNNKIKKTEKQVRRHARYLGLSKINTTINKSIFKNIDSEEKAYWLGFLYADGWVCTTDRNAEIGIELNISDIEHLYKFSKFLNANVEITTHKKRIKIANNKHITNTETCKIRIYSKEIAEDLIRHGVCKNKTYKESHPVIEDDFLFIHFLRGFLDGDGCIWKSKNSYGVKFTNANLKLLQYIQQNLFKLGFNSNIFTSNQYRHDLFIKGDKIKFLNMLYSNANIYLERKYKIYKDAVCFRNEANNKRAKSVKSSIKAG